MTQRIYSGEVIVRDSLNSRDNQNDIATAKAWAEESASSAAAALASAIEAALYDGAKVDEFSEVATTTLVDVGGYLRVISTGAVYKRAPEVAIDADLDYSGASGVKWYVQPAGGIFIVSHFGDGQAALVAAITRGHIDFRMVDGEHKTVTLTSGLTVVPALVRNMTIDASGITDSWAWTVTAAEYEAAKVLIANTQQDGNQFDATAHEYVVGDLLMMQSDLVFETGTNAQCAHWGKVSSVESVNRVKTYERTLCNLTTADSAVVRRLPQSTPCILEGIKMIGGANCKNGLRLTRFSDLYINDIDGDSFSERAVLLVENYRPQVGKVTGKNADASGLGYVLALSGNGWVRAEYVEAHRTRHAITWGASGVIPSVGGTFGDVVAYDCLSGGVDTHPGTIGVKQTGLSTLQFSNELSGEDGVVWQGVGGGCFVDGSGPTSRHNLLAQPSHVDAAFDTPPSWEFVIRGGSPTQHGAAFDWDGCGNIRGVDIQYDGITVLTPVYFDVGPIKVEYIKISGFGKSTTTRAIRVISEATTNIEFIELSGRWIASASEAVYVIGGTSGDRIQWSISSAKISGGTYAVRATNDVDAKIGTAFLDGTTAATVETGGATITTLS